MLDALPDESDKAPKLGIAAPDLKKVAAEAKLGAPLEVAGPIEADPMTVAPWIICLRSAAPDVSRQTYALFYRGTKLVSYRFAAIVDRCDEQAFTPF